MIYHAGVNICPSFKGVWAPTVLTLSPILNDGLTWSLDRNRHMIRTATLVHRDPIFQDFFARLAAHSTSRTPSTGR